MTQYVLANNVATTLASAVAPSDASITLASSAHLPVLPAGSIFPITLNDKASGLVYEVLYCTAISGATLTVMRGQEGTTAQSWLAGDYAFSTVTAATAAVSGGNPSNTFGVATATAPTHATPLAQVQSLVTAGTAGVSSFNSRTGNVTLLNTDVSTAIGYTPANQATTLTNPMTTNGDMIFQQTVTAPNGPVRLPIGATGQVLTVSGGAPAWVTPTPSGGSTIINPLNFGADPTGVNDSTAAFSAVGVSGQRRHVRVTAGTYLLNSNPSWAGFVTWDIQQGVTFTGAGMIKVSPSTGNIFSEAGTYKSIENSTSFYNGVFGYLENNSALNGYGVLGLHGSVQTADSAGTGARIGVSAFGVDNYVGGSAGLWGMYSTVVRASGATGAVQGMELDVANFGTTVPIYPAAPFATGLTAGIWCCTGGETTEPTAGGRPGTSSVGIAIIQNDSQTTKTAKFDKGLLFHNTSIAGADGTGGSNLGTAIAFATGHSMQWFNNYNQICGEVTNSGATSDSETVRLDFSSTGLIVQKRINGATMLGVGRTANAVNGIFILPGASGASPIIYPTGEANIDLALSAAGSGVIHFANSTVTGTAGAQAGFLNIKINGTPFKIPYYAMS